MEYKINILKKMAIEEFENPMSDESEVRKRNITNELHIGIREIMEMGELANIAIIALIVMEIGVANDKISVRYIEKQVTTLTNETKQITGSIMEIKDPELTIPVMILVLPMVSVFCWFILMLWCAMIGIIDTEN